MVRHTTDTLITTQTYDVKASKIVQFKMFGLRKAIAQIKAHPRRLATLEEAMALPGVGRDTADKIAEIWRQGRLERVTTLLTTDTAAEAELCGIWGVGPVHARRLVRQGIRSIAEARARPELLTATQRVTIGLYDELRARIPRDEVQRIGEAVREHLTQVAASATMEVCGSFRRGKPDWCVGG